MLDTDLAWLGGFWDGEGSITMFSHKEKNGGTKICPTVCIVNTDLALINKTRKLLEELGCNFLLQEYKPKNSRHSVRYDLITRNQKYIILFLEAVLPYIHSYKKHQGEIILDYCKRRVGKRYPYTKQDWEDLHKVRSSQTTRETPYAEKI